ncbi:MAG: hypothetical protein Q4B54_02220 [Coriobacteriales bacterium]|nr:hypothetical protein [Coriobacteriales bacterium]
MGQEIRTNTGAMLAARELLQDDQDAFCSFELLRLGLVLPYAASSDHDLRLAGLMHDALGAYERMVSRDAAVVQGLHEELSMVDQQMAAAWELGSLCAS